jgi:hypothetical protein
MLLNAARCARVTGFSRKWVEAVKAQPGGPFSGRFTTQVLFEAWVLSHPTFRASQYWLRRKQELEDLRKLEAQANGTFKRGMKLDAASVRRRQRRKK